MDNEAYHIPVLLPESIEGLGINPDGVYVDVTFGGGGHSIEILKRLKGGRLIAFDQDPEAADNIPEDERFTLIQENFRHMKNFLRFHGVKKVDGILADLGISSHQIDSADRGFSLRLAGDLDMRMSKAGERSAEQILNEYEVDELARIFRVYGELKRTGAIARAIVKARESARIFSSEDFIDILKPFTPGHKPHKFLAQIYQAIRIEVNDELNALRELLEQSSELLSKGGRLVVISYHSLEDRLVKNYMRAGNFSGVVEKDIYGHSSCPFKPLRNKPFIPSEKETNENNRARSAKLRIATRQA